MVKPPCDIDNVVQWIVDMYIDTSMCVETKHE